MKSIDKGNNSILTNYARTVSGDLQLFERYVTGDLDLEDLKESESLDQEERMKLEFLQNFDSSTREHKLKLKINKIRRDNPVKFLGIKQKLYNKTWFRSGIAAMLVLMTGFACLFQLGKELKIEGIQLNYDYLKNSMEEMSMVTEEKELDFENLKPISMVYSSEIESSRNSNSQEIMLSLSTKPLLAIEGRYELQKNARSIDSESSNELVLISPKESIKSLYRINSNQREIFKSAFISKMINLKEASSFVQFAWLYKDLQNLKEAEKAYKRAIKLDPNNPELYAGRAVFYTICKEYKKAENDYNMRVKLDPDNPDCYEFRAWFYNGMMAYDKAERDFTRSIALDPQSADVYRKRQYFYEKIGKFKKAKIDCRKYAELTKSKKVCSL